jgi:hypothetical protein
VEDNEKHINQKPDEKYPEPGVPVNESWAAMKDMLDTELPESTPTGGINTFLTKSWKFISILLISVGLLFFLYDQNKENSIKRIQSNTKNKAGDSLQNSEALPSSESNDEFKQEPRNNDSLQLSQSKPPIKTKQKSTGATVPGSVQSSPNHGHSGVVSGDIPEKPHSKQSSNTEIVNSKITAENGTTNFARRNKSAEIESNVKSINNQEDITSDIKSSQKNFRNLKAKDEIINGFNGTRPNLQYEDDLNNLSSRNSVIRRTDLNVVYQTRRIEGNFSKNLLQESFKKIDIQPLSSRQIGTAKPIKNKDLLKNIHFGLQWNAPIPVSGYDRYFYGANAKKQYYTPFIPGIWVSKAFYNGNELLLKLSPYQQYFGDNKKLTSSFIKLTDSTNSKKSTSLVKVIGMSAAIQYNFRISDRWLLGVGIQSFSQQKALLQDRSVHQVLDSLSLPKETYTADSLYAIKQSSAQWKYMSYYHLSGNAEISYRWNRCQLGLGIMLPFKNIINTSYGSLQPVSGQVRFRWRIK